MSSPLVSPPVVHVKALYCPNCGGPVELRGFAHTLNVVCPSCLTVLDASTPTLEILQHAQSAERIQPLIPLGSRGKFNGIEFEVIGFQRRVGGIEGDQFTWDEYVLFNPYQGFRYLSEYNGHWNFIHMLPGFPEAAMANSRPASVWEGRKYRRFSSTIAKTSYVLGEFPWRLSAGESVIDDDYISPPYMLSSEKAGNEITFSQGEYQTGAQIWQTFKLPGQPPPAYGVYPNQPSPFAGKSGSAWRVWLWLMVALAGLFFLTLVGTSKREVFRQSYTFTPGAAAEPSFVTPQFELTGRTSNLELHVDSDVANNWIYLNLALINEATGHALDFGREVSFYRDSGESEGSKTDNVVIPSVEPGRYYLRVEPEGNTSDSAQVNYTLTLRRDVPSYSFFFIAALLLSIPPFFPLLRSSAFEGRRWKESDYPPQSGGGD